MKSILILQTNADPLYFDASDPETELESYQKIFQYCKDWGNYDDIMELSEENQIIQYQIEKTELLKQLSQLRKDLKELTATSPYESITAIDNLSFDFKDRYNIDIETVKILNAAHDISMIRRALLTWFENKKIQIEYRIQEIDFCLLYNEILKSDCTDKKLIKHFIMFRSDCEYEIVIQEYLQ